MFSVATAIFPWVCINFTQVSPVLCFLKKGLRLLLQRILHVRRMKWEEKGQEDPISHSRVPHMMQETCVQAPESHTFSVLDSMKAPLVRQMPFYDEITSQVNGRDTYWLPILSLIPSKHMRLCLCSGIGWVQMTCGTTTWFAVVPKK